MSIAVAPGRGRTPGQRFDCTSGSSSAPPNLRVVDASTLGERAEQSLQAIEQSQVHGGVPVGGKRPRMNKDVRPSFYQDVFGEDLYGGQGGFHVEAFRQCVDGRLPQNAILSHDHLEGMLCRVAYASDVTFADDFPMALGEWRQRQHRWVRGDFQTVPWLFSRVPTEAARGERTPLRLLDRWKITYTLLGHLYPICVFLIACGSWCGVYHDGGGIAWMALATAQFSSVIGCMLKLLPRTLGAGSWTRKILFALCEIGQRLSASRTTFRAILRSWTYSLIFLLDHVVLVTDAMLRALYRITVSRRRLLEWKSSAAVQAGLARARKYVLLREMKALPFLATLIGVLVAATSRDNLLSAMPALTAWFMSPLLAHVFLRSPIAADIGKQQRSIQAG